MEFYIGEGVDAAHTGNAPIFILKFIFIAEKTDGCAHCNRSNPSKRCAKRHAKCLTKLFCDSVCEKAAHQKKGTVASPENNENLEQSSKTETVAKSKAALAADKKKKAEKKAKKKPNQGTTRCSGEFWFHQ